MFEFGHRLLLASLVVSASACSLLFEPADGENGEPTPACSSASRAPTACLKDGFDTQDGSKWKVYRNSDNRGVEIGAGTLVLDMSADGGDVALIASQEHYSLQDSQVVVRVHAVPDTSYNDVWSVLTLYSPDVFASRAMELGCTGGRLIASTSRGDVESWQQLGEVDCDLAESPFWRISHSGIEVSFSHSSDGANWKTIAIASEEDLNLDDVVVSILLENYSPNRSSSDSTFVVEAINP